MAADPFAELGLTSDATESEIREARRRLAKRHHPDAGGDDRRMRNVNAAAAEALRARAVSGAQRSGQRSDLQNGPHAEEGRADEAWGVHPVASDVPSFTVEALPVETFEALLIVAADIAEVLDDDPPYRLDTVLGSPLECWCRLEVVPDAGASTVSLFIGRLDDRPAPPSDVVRDLWIAALNELDWDD